MKVQSQFWRARLGFAQKLQSVPRFELRHPVHEVTLVVPGRDRLVLRTARLGASREELGNLNEIVLEARLADDFKQPRRLIGRIPERVGDTARLVDVSAGSRLGHFVPHSNPDTALENVRQLVFHHVRVRRDETSRIDRVLDNRETAARLVPPHLEVDTQPSQADGLTFTRADHKQPPLLNSHLYVTSGGIFATHACILIGTLTSNRSPVNNQVTVEIPEIARKY